MDPLRRLLAEPRRFSLPIAAALGAALGFYPGAGFLPAALALASGCASLGAVVPGLGLRGARLRGLQARALALGLVLGSVVAWREAGLAAPPSAAPPVAAPAGQQATRGLVALSPLWAEGRLSADSSPARNGFRSYPLKVERLGLSGKGIAAELSYPGGAGGTSLRVLARAGPEIDAGSLIRASGAFSAPAAAAAGAAATGTPSAGAAAAGAALFARPRELLLIDRGGPVDRARSALRSACRQAIARVGQRSAGLMQALILGVKDSLAPEEAEAFKAAGCSHILALSGEHLSVLALIAIAGLKPLMGPARARLGGALLASLFMWVAGPGPSLLRAVLMAWIGAVAIALDRPQDWLGSLSLAFLAMLPLDPASARGLGFTLSYLAVWGLAVLGPRFSFLLGRALPPFLRESASSSLAAQAAVSPLLALSFGYLQFAGILASMAAGPIVIATMWWGMGAALVCAFLPFAAPLAVPVSELLYGALMAIMRSAAAVPVLPLASPAARVLACLAVAGLAALVYARPYAEYRAWVRGRLPSRLRLAPGFEGPPRGGGPRHDQALRPELPRQ